MTDDSMNDLGIAEHASEDDVWQTLRQELLARVSAWIDTVAETDQGRNQLAELLQGLERSIDTKQQGVVSAFGPDAVRQTLSGLCQMTGELTALRHDLKSSIKQSRAFAEKLAGDAARIVSASSTVLDDLAARGGQPINDHDTNRDLVISVVELDEAMTRLCDAFESTIHAAARPPSQPSLPWHARGARDLVQRHHDAWTNAWQAQRTAFTGLADGLRLTSERLLAQLRKLHIERIGSPHEMFDPHTMQVLEVTPSPEHPPGTVLSVLRPGYRQNAWIIRPAQVVTSSSHS